MNESRNEKETHGSKASFGVVLISTKIDANNGGIVLVVKYTVIDSTSLAAYIAQVVVE